MTKAHHFHHQIEQSRISHKSEIAKKNNIYLNIITIIKNAITFLGMFEVIFIIVQQPNYE